MSYDKTRRVLLLLGDMHCRFWKNKSNLAGEATLLPTDEHSRCPPPIYPPEGRQAGRQAPRQTGRTTAGGWYEESGPRGDIRRGGTFQENKVMIVVSVRPKGKVVDRGWTLQLFISNSFTKSYASAITPTPPQHQHEKS